MSLFGHRRFLAEAFEQAASGQTPEQIARRQKLEAEAQAAIDRIRADAEAYRIKKLADAEAFREAVNAKLRATEILQVGGAEATADYARRTAIREAGLPAAKTFEVTDR